MHWQERSRMYATTRAIKTEVQSRGSAIRAFTSQADAEYTQSELNDAGFVTDLEHHNLIHAKGCTDEMTASAWTLAVKEK